MATFERTCEQCGTAFETSRRQARFCSATCRSRAHRGKPALSVVAGESPKPSTKREPAPPPVYDTLAEQVRTLLTEAKALDTIAGMAAIRVAQQIDRGGDSGSAVATLSKELSRLVDAAKVEAAPRNKDAADDITARVNEKLLRLVQ